MHKRGATASIHPLELPLIIIITPPPPTEENNDIVVVYLSPSLTITKMYNYYCLIFKHPVFFLLNFIVEYPFASPIAL